MKIKIQENVYQIQLPDGYWLHHEITKDGSIFSFKFVKYWHPCEIKHMFRDYASISSKSYINLGLKLNSLGLCLPDKNDDETWDLNKIIIAISENIPMNTKGFSRFFDKNKTVKGIFGSREDFKKYLFKISSYY